MFRPGADVYPWRWNPGAGGSSHRTSRRIPTVTSSPSARLMFPSKLPNNPTVGELRTLRLERGGRAASGPRLPIVAQVRRNKRDVTSSNPPPSRLQGVPGRQGRGGSSFHSLLRDPFFHRTGWRFGFAIGGRPLIAALGQGKANTDSASSSAIPARGQARARTLY